MIRPERVLTNDEARQIREMWVAGDRRRVIAARFGVSDSAVRSIYEFRTYQEAGGPPPEDRQSRAKPAPKPVVIQTPPPPEPLPDHIRRYPSALKISSAVARVYGVQLADLAGDSRLRRFVFPRQVAMACIRALTGLSSSQIGHAFDRDHSTVLYAVEKVSEVTTADAAALALFDEALQRAREAIGK